MMCMAIFGAAFVKHLLTARNWSCKGQKGKDLRGLLGREKLRVVADIVRT